MKLYRITYTRPNAPAMTVRWAGTQADATHIRMDVMAQDGLKRKEIGIEDIEIPTKKEELLAWLNERSV